MVGDPGRIRTCDLQLRRQSGKHFYSMEVDTKRRPKTVDLQEKLTLEAGARPAPIKRRRKAYGRPSEQAIQRAVCQHLRQRGASGLVWWHTPNGGRRSPVEAAIFNGLGVRAGVADLILLRDGRAFALELKTERGRPTAAQMQFISEFRAAGGVGRLRMAWTRRCAPSKPGSSCEGAQHE
jgi:hypothetical protein